MASSDLTKDYAAAADELELVESDVLLLSLPADLLASISSHLLPSESFACVTPPTAWRDVLMWCATAKLCGEVLTMALVDAVPAFAGLPDGQLPTQWPSILRRLMHMNGAGRWLLCPPLRAVRPVRPQLQPVQTPPKLSGASLCAFRATTAVESQLCLFGGRASDGGADTSDKTFLVTVSWPSSSRSVALWDLLLAEVRPAARCYHSASVWEHGPFMSSSSSSSSMVIFGGAGEGDGQMHNDAWMLTRSKPKTSTAAPTMQWRCLEPLGGNPAPRSSHVCVSWPCRRALIVHGGLGNDGVTGDVWVLAPPTAEAGRGAWRGGGGGAGAVSTPRCEWRELATAGPQVRRAHHAAGLVGVGEAAKLLIFSGQDDGLLTVHSLASLCLGTATWDLVRLPMSRPHAGVSQQAAAVPVGRIDAGAATLPGVGIVIFGGVGDDFGFVDPSNAWLIRHGTDTCPRLPVAPPTVSTCALPLLSPSSSGGGAPSSDAPSNDAPSSEAPSSEAVAWKGPRARACLGMCADGLRVFGYGGFDGETDLSDLWCLSLLPPNVSHTARASASSAATSAGVAASSSWPGRTEEEQVSVEEIKRRRSHQANVLHATPGANGANFIPIHVLVGQAAQAWDGMQKARQQLQQAPAAAGRAGGDDRVEAAQ